MENKELKEFKEILREVKDSDRFEKFLRFCMERLERGEAVSDIWNAWNAGLHSGGQSAHPLWQRAHKKRNRLREEEQSSSYSFCPRDKTRKRSRTIIVT